MKSKKEQPQHTPTPWKVKGSNIDAESVSVGTTENFGPEWVSKANAAYIVRAVNAYQPMLEALREAYVLFASKGALSAEAITVWDHVEKAIAKAEGK